MGRYLIITLLLLWPVNALGISYNLEIPNDFDEYHSELKHQKYYANYEGPSFNLANSSVNIVVKEEVNKNCSDLNLFGRDDIDKNQTTTGLTWGQVPLLSIYELHDNLLCWPNTDDCTQEEVQFGTCKTDKAVYAACATKDDKIIAVCINQATNNPIQAKEIFESFTWLEDEDSAKSASSTSVVSKPNTLNQANIPTTPIQPWYTRFWRWLWSWLYTS